MDPSDPENVRIFSEIITSYSISDALHGGLVLYNGGFTAGTTALILLPILEHYIPTARERLKDQTIRMKDLIIVELPGKEKGRRRKK